MKSNMIYLTGKAHGDPLHAYVGSSGELDGVSSFTKHSLKINFWSLMSYFSIFFSGALRVF